VIENSAGEAGSALTSRQSPGIRAGSGAGLFSRGLAPCEGTGAVSLGGHGVVAVHVHHRGIGAGHTGEGATGAASITGAGDRWSHLSEPPGIDVVRLSGAGRSVASSCGEPPPRVRPGWPGGREREPWRPKRVTDRPCEECGAVVVVGIEPIDATPPRPRSLGCAGPWAGPTAPARSGPDRTIGSPTGGSPPRAPDGGRATSPRWSQATPVPGHSGRGPASAFVPRAPRWRPSSRRP